MRDPASVVMNFRKIVLNFVYFLSTKIHLKKFVCIISSSNLLANLGNNFTQINQQHISRIPMMSLLLNILIP